jgi:hypothetical protein
VGCSAGCWAARAPRARRRKARLQRRTAAPVFSHRNVAALGPVMTAAAERANQYLDREEGKSLGFSKYSPQVGLLLAQSFEKRNMTDDAISMYVKVWSAHMGLIQVSAPAVESWMTLSHKRNRVSDDPNGPSDRQGAYEGGYRFLELTGRFKDKMSPAEVKLWERVQKLTDQYVADPNVKSMEQVLKEKEEAAKRR